MELIKLKNDRQSNLELLRIIAIFLIIGHHLALYSKININSYFSFNTVFIDILIIGGKLGAILFIIITGYFSISKDFNYKKTIKLELQILFYSVLFLCIFLILQNKIDYKIGLKQIIQNIFPTIFTRYWFMTNFILLYIFSPYLNIFIKNIDKEKLKKLIIILIIILMIIPGFTTSKLALDNLIYFIFYYILGAYIFLYGDDIKKYNYKNFTIIFYIITILYSVSCRFLSQYVSALGNYINHFSGISSVLILFISYNLFMWFLNVHIKQNKFINTIASTTLGIYLIHDNEFVRKILWSFFDTLLLKLGQNYLVLIGIIFILAVFTVCCIIEFLRKKTIDDKIISKILK